MNFKFTKRLVVAAVIVASALGVKADLTFRLHRYDEFKATPVKENNIVFMGNSITNMNEWRECFGDDARIVNRGNSGALAQEILDNVESVIAGHPAKVFIGVGTNDLGSAGLDAPEMIAAKLGAICERFQVESPTTKVYVQSILPSISGSRTVAKAQAANLAIKRAIEAAGATYVDVFQPMMGITTGAISYDYLHVTAKGYKIWCDILAPLVGVECSYPSTFTENNSGLSGSSGMRSTYWSVQSIKSTDVLFIGDEMVHGGEWCELLSSADVKNRGTQWGYGGLTLAQWLAAMPAIFETNADRKTAPRMVMLHMGLVETNGSSTVDTIKAQYKRVIDKIRTYAPASKTKIVITSQIPNGTAATNTSRVVPVNTMLQQLAQETENAQYADLYTPLVSTGNVANAAMITSNYVYGKGYNAIAQVLAPIVGNGAKAMTTEEFDAHYAKIAARTSLGKVIESVKAYQIGDGLGQYPVEAVMPITMKMAEAYELLASPTAETSAIQTMATELTAALSAANSSINQPKGWNEAKPSVVMHIRDYRNKRYCSETESLMTSVDSVVSPIAQWKVIARGDGTFDIQNVMTGNYMNPVATYNTQMSTTATRPATGWSFGSSNTPGTYIIYSGTTQLNTTNSGLGYKIYSYGSGTMVSDTGCQYILTEAEALPIPEAPKPGEDPSNPVLTMTNIVCNGTPIKVSDALAEPVLKGGNYQTVAVDLTINTALTAMTVITSVCDTVASPSSSGYYWGMCARNNNFGVIMKGRNNGTEGWFTKGLGNTVGRQKYVLVVPESGDKYTVYMNGTAGDISIANFTATYGQGSFGNCPNGNAIYLGGSIHSSSTVKNNLNDATIHSIRFYNRALSATDVAGLVWDNLSGVTMVPTTATPASNTIYDIYGRSYASDANLPAGIYIRNGKKFVVR